MAERIAGFGGTRRARLGSGLCLLVVGCTADITATHEITIEPENSSIEIVNGAIVGSQFSAMSLYADGTTRELAGLTWQTDDSSVGAIDGSGFYTPTGDLGGIVEIAAATQTLHGSTTLTVKLHIVDEPPDPVSGDALVSAAANLPQQAASLDPAITWAYPYDGTVFPRGLAAPELMWSGGSSSDLYYIHLTSPTFELETFALPPYDQPLPYYTMSATRWAELTNSTSGTVDIAIARLANGVATGVIHHQWTIAPVQLPGTLYYSSIVPGAVDFTIRAYDFGAGAAADLFGDYSPTGDEHCPKCHTVSADGGHIVMTMAPLTALESVTFNLATGATTYVGYPSSGPWDAAALSAHGEVVVPNFAPIRASLVAIATAPGAYDATTGAPIPNTGLDAVRAWMPTFSPDDGLLAYVAETPTPGGCQYGSGMGSSDGELLKECSQDLHAFDWDPVARAATNDRQLVAKGSDTTRDVLQYPTVSPLHELVVYARGPELGSLSPINNELCCNPGALFAVRPDTPGVEASLDQLGGVAYPFAAGDRDRAYDFMPSFAPIVAGGYAWVAFVSRRSYGNEITGAPSSVKQLWISAIDLDAPGGTDPSHPAFWLPGQNPSPNTINQGPKWALSPCLDGDGCVAPQ